MTKVKMKKERKKKEFSLRIVLKKPKPGERVREFKFREIILLLFIFLTLLIHARRVFPPLVREMNYIATRLIFYPNYSYEEKMKEKVGGEYYDWTKLVKQHTSVESFVIHPPQMWPWGQSGNPEFSQYFLYPAKLIREDRAKLFKKNDISHVLIAWGEGGVEERLYGWPKFPVFAQKIYFLPQRRRVEVEGLEDLREWLSDAQRTINYSDGQVFDLTYTSSSYDYWVKPVNFVLLPTTRLGVKVKSNWLNSTALIAKVSFGKGKFAVFSSDPNQKTDEWETLTLSNLYHQATQFAKLQGWGGGQLKIEAIGIDTGHPAKMPYLEKWGLIEVEKGEDERLKFLDQQIANSQNFFSLGNIYTLTAQENDASLFYQKAQLLEPSDPWVHFWLAEIANKRNNKAVAEQEYKEAINLAPEISWFYFALGEFYRREGNLEKAISKYQESINLDPESSWSHLALGEIYERQNNLDLAYQHYRLAGDPPRHAFLSDGKIAWEKVKKIEAKEKEIIAQSQETIKKNPEDFETRLALGNAYIILGELAKAKEQYEVIYRNAPERYRFEKLFKIPPIIVDRLSQPLYGVEGRAVETVLLGTKPAVVLDNYHGYIRYSKEFFPTENGTIELSWRPPDDSGRDQIPRNLIYQIKGLFVWTAENKLNFAIFNRESKKWEVISSIPLSWEGGKWYRIGVSYGKRGMFIFLDGKKIEQGSFAGGISEKNDIFLGRGPLWSISDETFLLGYFETIKIYDYQKLRWE